MSIFASTGVNERKESGEDKKKKENKRVVE